MLPSLRFTRSLATPTSLAVGAAPRCSVPLPPSSGPTAPSCTSHGGVVPRRWVSVYGKGQEQYVPVPKSTVILTVDDRPGALQGAIGAFAKHNVSMSFLQSRPKAHSNSFDFFVDFQGALMDDNVQNLMRDLRKVCASVQPISSLKVPWFPTRLKDLDVFANDTLDAGSDLDADHPGFHDEVYRARRQELANLAINHRQGQPVPRVEYTEDETKTWGTVWQRLVPLVREHGCQEHNTMLDEVIENCGYAENNIPQVADINEFMKAKTGFCLRPVAGLLSSRNFLYGLAFRTFFSTQYIRHHSRPLYTPEPDICHELLGHAPLFANQEFADFSQEIGLAAFGATDEQIVQLARCYWFSVEFGLCQQNGQRKAYGAGLLSSFGELEYAMSDEPEIRPFDPFNAANQDFPITTYQPVYYLASDFKQAQIAMKEFSESFARPFHVRYNAEFDTVDVDRNVERELPPSEEQVKEARRATEAKMKAEAAAAH